MRASIVVLVAAVAGVAVSAAARAPQANEVDAALFQGLTWRNIGPFRGGRTKAVSGVPAQPNVFYIGAVNGGVWTTNDYGRTWRPIFDDQPTASIGAIAVASSDPNVIYVGSGEGMQRPDLSTGDGMYKSTDAGRSWTRLGLRDGQQIPEIVVDPRDPNRLFVAVLGHPYGPNSERGIFRSTDGGRTFERVLYKDENTGGVDVTLDPADPQTVYAVLWESRQGPWENAVWTGPGSGLFKSTDGGTTWRPLTRGLPAFAQGLGRIGVTVAPSLRTRLFAVVESSTNGGIYRSDDAGDSWTRVNDDPRLVARPYDASDIRVHPTNPDIVYVPTIVAWRSRDGGKTFEAFRGAPGGDDYQKIWINPGNPNVMIMTADQGAIVSVNGGETWSSWFNQPTAAFYHVSTDNAFPYRVCGGQQDSGSACVSSRGEWGQITVRDWGTVGVEEWGYVAPDPLDPDIVYGGKITRFDRRTGQVQTITPRKAGLRALRTAPVLFSPTDPRTLFFAANTIWKTTNGGQAWTEISPELSRTTWEIPPSVGAYRTAPTAQPARRGVVYTIAPSPIDAQVMWAGTDDGLIYLTRNGGNQWNDVTPKALVPWAKVSLIEASHFDSNIAYAAVNSLRLDDLRPHIYRTKDGGATWTEITRGLPATGPINAIREDGQRRGLLFAAGELGVSVSFDDGESWQSLRLNMPATSVRDVVVKDADLVAGTHGRGFWILDDLSPLRQITADIARQPSYLFRPPTVWRYRWNKNTDTPLPPDEPAAPNPPDGVALSYLLSGTVTGPVTLDIVDPGTGETIRSYSSASPVEPPLPGRNIPDYWIQPPQRLRTTPGLHRFVWDLRYAPPPSESRGYPIAAVAGNTLPEPRGLFVLPGTYQARLNVEGRSYRQPIVVRMDPRVKTPAADLTLQFNLSKEVDAIWRRLRTARDTLTTRIAGASGDSAAELQKQLGAVTDALRPLQDLFESLQEADVKPSAALEAAVKEALSRAAAALAAMTPTT